MFSPHKLQHPADGIQNYKDILLTLILASVFLERLGTLVLPHLTVTQLDLRLAVAIMALTATMAAASFTLQGRGARVVNLGLHSLICTCFVYFIEEFYLKGMCLVFFVSFVLKLISFLVEERGSTTLGQFLYFLVAPSLIYESKYKTRKKICVVSIVKNAGAVLVLFYAFIFTVNNFLLPYVQHIVDCASFPAFLVNFIRLGVSTSLCWIIFFRCVFVNYYGLVCGLTLYDDCVSHEDWWNSRCIRSFWQKWNVPFHRWMKRYVYNPLLVRYSKTTATVACFTLSAVLHEYITIVCYKKVVGYMFLGMWSQVLFMGRMNNTLFWLVFCFFGQPLCLLLCYRSIMNVRGDYLGKLFISGL